jgi:hypothetical protein
MRVLLCGESWVTHSPHIKGVDSVTTSSYVQGADELRAVLGRADIEADYLPGRLVPPGSPARPVPRLGRFPGSAAELAGYGAVTTAVPGLARLRHPVAQPPPLAGSGVLTGAGRPGARGSDRPGFRSPGTDRP